MLAASLMPCLCHDSETAICARGLALVWPWRMLNPHDSAPAQQDSVPRLKQTYKRLDKET